MSSNQGYFARQWNRASCCVRSQNEDECEVDGFLEINPIYQKGITKDKRNEEVDSYVNLDDLVYKMNNKRRGTALIFNHMHFAEHSSRTGTNKDRDDLEAILTKLQFEVRIFNNLTTAKIFEELHRVAELKHYDSDCLIVTVMTHGSREWLYSFDGAYALRDMTILFNDENCPSLKGKPRLFFIQACRGSQLDSGFTVPGPYNYIQSYLEQTSSDAARLSPNQILNEAFPELDEVEKEFVHNQPAFNDFLIVRSTMIDYYSFRNTGSGAWFIQDLCRELELRGTTCDILNLLNYVNWAVSERESSDPSGKADKKKTTICTTTRLTKILYFNVKKHSNRASAKKKSKKLLK